MLRVLETAGREPLSAIDRKAILAGLERRKEKPSTAQAFLYTLRPMFAWAIAAELVTADPTTGIKVSLKPKRKGGYPPWTDEDMLAYEAFWAIGTRERLLFDLLCFTGLRNRRHLAPRQAARPQGPDPDRHREEPGDDAGRHPDAGGTEGDDRQRPDDRRPRLHCYPPRHAVE